LARMLLVTVTVSVLPLKMAPPSVAALLLVSLVFPQKLVTS